MDNYIEERPWGKFEILCDEEYTKVKKITVNSGGVLSYQYHFKRNELWMIVKGEAVVKINDVEYIKTYGDIVTVSAEDKHNVRNEQEEDLVFIEIQTGEYFSEDDIVRIEDKYDRK
jgi:mannose-6-phosphate isomerase-like protein (cupin superfamily)